MGNYKINPIDIPDEKTTFSPREWKYFIEEVKMRGIEKVDLCINNAKFLAKLDISDEQIEAGEGKMFTLEELRNFYA
ncbi:MAG: hypothetical protein IJQ82_08180 [Selenomonadaceae bacterium]|nr:hypothetical protein [Selenomonadaceae bacterium]